MDETGKIIKEIASRVNKTLKHFEKDYVSVIRCPGIINERCTTLEEFIERRFNFEAYKVKELKEAVKLTEGHLFYVESLENADPIKRRYKKVHIRVISLDMIDSTDQNLKYEIENAKNFIGGSHIVFNGVKQKIKLQIIND